MGLADERKKDAGDLLSPTSPQLKIVLIGEDYGLKVSIRRKQGWADSVKGSPLLL